MEKLGLDLIECGTAGIYLARLARALERPIILPPSAAAEIRKATEPSAMLAAKLLEGTLWVEDPKIPLPHEQENEHE